MNKSQEKYILVIRLLAFGVVAFLWYLSIIWSADGFSINDPELHWIGIGLALSVTVVQLVFNRGSANPTIFLVGLAAYVYGFATNFIGISKVIGLDFTTANFTENAFGFMASGMGVVALSLIVEAAPESFLLWALYPKEQTPGDFISSLASGIKLPKKNGKPSNFGFQNVPVRSSVPEHSKPIPQRKPLPDERSILLWIEQEYHKNNKNMPSYSRIVKNTSLTSTSKVKPYVERFMERIS